MLGTKVADSLTGAVMLRTRSLAVCLSGALLSVAALVYGLVVAHEVKHKLSWQGRPVEYWFNQLGFRGFMRSPSGAVRKWGSWNETPEASAKAVRGIGTNAIGFYLRKLKRHVGTREGQIALAASRVGFVRKARSTSHCSNARRRLRSWS